MLPSVENHFCAQLAMFSVHLQCRYYSSLKCQLMCLSPLLDCGCLEVSYGTWTTVELPVLGRVLGKYLRRKSMNTRLWFSCSFILPCIFQIFRYKPVYFEHKTNWSKNINRIKWRLFWRGPRWQSRKIQNSPPPTHMANLWPHVGHFLLREIWKLC